MKATPSRPPGSGPRIVVVGAGGVGGYFGATLQSGGCEVVFVARGANLEALRTSGLRVSGARGDVVLPQVAATDDPAEAGKADLVLLCVKSYDLDEAAAAFSSCGGTVLTIQNGVDAAERVAAICGDRVLAGSTGIVADLQAPGHVHVVSTYARITFGEPAGGLSPRVAQVAEWLAFGSIEVDPQEQVAVALWEKMAVICGMGGLTTLFRAPIGAVLGDDLGLATFRRIVAECEAVARARGVPLPAAFVQERLAYARNIDPAATSSMYRDMVRGRRVEIDHLNGTVVRFGAAAGVRTPVNEAVYAGVRLQAAHR